MESTAIDGGGRAENGEKESSNEVESSNQRHGFRKSICSRPKIVLKERVCVCVWKQSTEYRGE